MDFFVRSESPDVRLAKEAPGDIDLIISPRDGMLVVVCETNGVHACGRCLEPFVHEEAHPLRPLEYNPGGHGTRMLLHAQCIDPVKSYPGNIIHDRVRGHQAKRFKTRALKPFLKDAG